MFCHCIVSAVSSFFFLRKKKQLCHFCKRRKLCICRDDLGNNIQCFFLFLVIFLKHTQMNGAFLKTQQIKMQSKLFQIRTIHTLLLFCSQSEDRSTISSGSPTAQTGNRKSKKNSEKSDQNFCLLICPVKRGEPLSHLCVWHWCV